MGGISSADGNLTARRARRRPELRRRPPGGHPPRGQLPAARAAISSSTAPLDLGDDTSIGAGGDVRFDDRIQGAKGLSVSSDGQVVLFDDVALTGGDALALGRHRRALRLDQRHPVRPGRQHLARQRGHARALGRRDPRPRREPVARGERRRRRDRERPADGRERVAQHVREEQHLDHRHRGAPHQAGLARPDRAERLDRDGQLDRLLARARA